MANAPDRHARAILPIPDVRQPGLTTYDAKDPATSFPPIEPLRPPGGCAERAGGPARRRRLRCLERVRRAVPHADRRAARRRWAAVQPVPHHGAVRADPPGAADGPQPPLRRHGQHHRDGDLGAGAVARCARTRWRRSRQTLTLNGYSTAQFGKCHEVPVWQTSPMGPFDAWPSKGGGFEHFYGFIGGENNQWDPALYEGTTPIEPPATAGGGLPPHRRPHRPLRELDPPAEGADARQAVLRLLRAGRHPRAAPRRPGVDREVPGPVLPRLGRRSASGPSPGRRSSASSPPTPS